MFSNKYMECAVDSEVKVLVLDCRDLKKRTGDWFYDQRVNRFSALPGHDLVKASLKKKPQCKWRKRQSARNP